MFYQSGGELTWIESAGGPLLLVAGELLPSWGGVWPPLDGRPIEARFRYAGQDAPATDYDRACDIEGYTGLIDIGAGQGLILGDEPLSTAWLPAAVSEERSPTSGTLIRWGHADSEADVLEAVAHVPETLWQDERLLIHVDSQPLYLIDAGNDVRALEQGDYLIIALAAGTYEVSTVVYEPDDRTELVLHRLRYSPNSTEVEQTQ